MTTRKKRTTTITAAACCESTPDGLEFTEWRGDTQHVVRVGFDGSPATAAYVIESALRWIQMRRESIESTLKGVEFDLKSARGEKP